MKILRDNRKWLIVWGCSMLLLLLTGFIVRRYLSAVHPQAAGVFIAYLLVLITPQLCLSCRDEENIFRYLFSILLGALPALLIFGGGLPALLVVFGFVAFILAVAQLFSQVARTLERVMGFVLTMFFFSSFLWSGHVLGEGFLRNIAVWLSPQAMISSAYENFSFAHLPDVYNIWLGPVVPLPDSWWLAMTYYLVPALLLLELTLLCKRIWRDA